MNCRTLSLIIVLAICPTSVWAQAGVSSMSVGISRAEIARYGPGGRYRMPLPEMIRVEEYINYHRHDLPLPTEGNRVRLDLQQMLLENGKTVVQVGITTPRALAQDKIRPMNIVLVIDRSGSMSGDRMANVKTAIRAFVEQFRESDKVSIVGFSNDASVHLEPCGKTEIGKIQNAIDEIHVGGGTNLFAGLMLGYKQALRHYDAERTNRVIFLTDGNANIGTTETKEIAEQSKECNQRGISLSTIGLGKDFNHELLRELADKGRGVVHFVNDSKDIKKTFVDEIDSLLVPAASKVRLTLDFGKAAGSAKFYGYSPEKKGDSKYSIKLDNLNHGATQVVMVRLPNDKKPNVRVSLKYKDAVTGKDVELTSDSTKTKKRKSALVSINRNYAIALVANAMHAAAECSNDGDCDKAEKKLRKGIAKARRQCDNEPDKYVSRIIKLASDYQQKIAECIARGQRD